MKLLNKDFLIAFANGDEIEWQCSNVEWYPLSSSEGLDFFDDPNIRFRIKPKTVTLTYDIPKPFKPEIGEPYWFEENSEILYNYNNNWEVDVDIISNGVWRNKEDVIKVIEAQKEAIANSFANDLGDVDEK